MLANYSGAFPSPQVFFCSFSFFPLFSFSPLSFCSYFPFPQGFRNFFEPLPMPKLPAIAPYIHKIIYIGERFSKIPIPSSNPSSNLSSSLPFSVSGPSPRSQPPPLSSSNSLPKPLRSKKMPAGWWVVVGGGGGFCCRELNTVFFSLLFFSFPSSPPCPP